MSSQHNPSVVTEATEVKSRVVAALAQVGFKIVDVAKVIEVNSGADIYRGDESFICEYKRCR